MDVFELLEPLEFDRPAPPDDQLRPGARPDQWVVDPPSRPADQRARPSVSGQGAEPVPSSRLAKLGPIGLAMTGAGLFLALLLAYVYVFTALSFQRSQQTLLASISSQVAATYNLALGDVPPQGRPVAVLEIPALHMVDAVVQGTDVEDLRSGPGHLPTTPLPGEPGNAVFAGRRATYGGPFGAIGSLRRNDLIRVIDGLGTFKYRVTRIETVLAGHQDVVTPTPTNRLTLVTASSGVWPKGRLAVIAKLEGSPVQGTVTPTFGPAPSQLGLQGDPSSAPLALGWLLVFAALLAATWWLLRRWRQPAVVYLLATPLLVAVALFACESVIGLLPATV